MTGTRTLGALLLGAVASIAQPPAVSAVDERLVWEYTGVYQWEKDSFVHLQMWDGFSGFGKPQFVSFDESGQVRTLYPTGRNQFFAGPGAAIATSIESRVDYQRDAGGKITSLTWRRDASARVARRVEIEKREDVRFMNGNIKLAGTLITPSTSRQASRDCSRPRLRRRESRIPASMGAVPDPPRNRCPRLR
ncbi:MAG TPA: hypothetical protein VKE70_10160 [Candidatus Solibacter sp.]|nr:hypothetical protein [Candidatus Solibacter sp.]